MTLIPDIVAQMKRLRLPLGVRGSNYGSDVWLDAEGESTLFHEIPLLAALQTQESTASPEDIWDAIVTSAVELRQCGHPISQEYVSDSDERRCMECDAPARRAEGYPAEEYPAEGAINE